MERFYLQEAGLIFRTYEPRDRKQVWLLRQEGRDLFADLPENPGHVPEDLQEIEAHYLGWGSHFWVVEETGRLVAMTAIRRLNDETAELKRMRVQESWRRRGIAQRLLDIAIRFCRQQGYKGIVLETTDRQVAAQRLYEKNGFVRLGERQAGPLRVFHYRRELTSSDVAEGLQACPPAGLKPCSYERIAEPQAGGL